MDKGIQVCYSLRDEATRDREVRALLAYAARYAVEDLCIVTMDEEQTIEADGMSIRVVPAWKWLLEDLFPLTKS